MKSKIVVFILTMPNNNSWNGKWCGEDTLYCFVKNFGTSKKAEKTCNDLEDNYYYNFGDGWGANVECKLISADEARKYRKKSQGFCGYEWMIKSIISDGKIVIS